MRASSDDVVRGTNDDASLSRLSAVTAGYLDDTFAKLFVRRPMRRNPIINRGTYLRTSALDKLVSQFAAVHASLGRPWQLVSLGAGSDTRYLLMKTSGQQPRKYFEIDFAEVTTRKAMALSKPSAQKLLGTAQPGKGGAELYADDYCLLAGDLRHFEQELVPRLEQHGFDREQPTLFLAECVLVYMLPQDADRVLRWTSTHCPTAGFIIYEPCQPDDAFGQVMVQNLRGRGVELPGLSQYPDLLAQRTRFLNLGWHGATAVDMDQVHDRHTAAEELRRIAKLELLDELEEWRLLAQHYGIVWAWCEETKGDGSTASQPHLAHWQLPDYSTTTI
ncbi:S-adenosyl-L-methionine-dependent methyltransferase [Thamnocephalis sphaerospora]|uniref:Leucine carboxyl methyltransferase 1 n=1 Tax=Thamnocephalis sphaerospora TaxID=78915 RepID=A0A4P9XKP5_9FUNG|nr:S-adenosyl-L-methionine-dependent methyltransferase [Thamnocephalis sphaerospora]|eukprot:RKP06383.1 S-adenosyl-L-methionine-dependent methyltransferase [Thamnocephalis sphaerospora]